MKSVLLFPGLDALFATSNVRRWTAVDCVSQSLSEASGHLAGFTGEVEDLRGFLERTSRPHVVDFERTLVAMTAIQIGVARELSKSKKWDLVLGCSQGDVARSVISEAVSYKDAVELLWHFGEFRKLCPVGKTANLRTTDGGPLAQAQLDWIRESGASLSQWSPIHGTVSGGVTVIETLCKEGRARGLKVKPLLAYPIHSPVMAPLVTAMESQWVKWKIQEPRGRIFSSVWARYLVGAEEIRTEAIAGAINPLRWLDTLDVLLNEERITHVINVGPSTTLAGWLRDQVVVEESWDLLGAQET